MKSWIDEMPFGYIDQAPMEEIISSLSLEKEDIFMLNRLAAALEDIPPAEMPV